MAKTVSVIYAWNPRTFPYVTINFHNIYIILIVYSWTLFIIYVYMNYLQLQMFAFYFTNFCPSFGLRRFYKYCSLLSRSISQHL
jgi:hypothetical protein